MKKNIILLIMFLLCNLLGQDYKNPNLPVNKRVVDLISKMTIHEKVRQLDMYQPTDFLKKGKWSEEKTKNIAEGLGIGSIHDFYPSTAKEANEFQKIVIKNSRLNIPVMVIEEGLHGYSGKGSTTFPIPIGLASTWNTSLINNIGKVIGKEARAHNVHMILGPVLGLARDPRWGRVEETYGEDPCLTSEMGLAIVTGMQGDDLTSNSSVVSEPKHYGVHSMPESGTNTGPIYIGEREARSSFLYPFEVAVKKGNALGVMAAYHEWDGIPCVANKLLLKDILRDEWGFNGFVLSDLGAIAMQVNNHKTAENAEDALALTIEAGLDMQFYDFNHDEFESSIIQSVKNGKLSEKDLNRAVESVLKVKFMLGLFDNPYIDNGLRKKVHRTKKHRELALQAGRESIVLLKNQNDLLPLSKKIKSIAVIGPMADVSALGGYSTKEAKGVTVLEGLKNKIGDQTKIYYETGATSITTQTVVDSKYLKTPDGKSEGLLAEFFNNGDLSGKPKLSRVETNMTPYWHTNSPDENINSDNFSVRWTGTISAPYSGYYEIGIITDDKGKLFFDNKLIIDNWTDYKQNVMMTQKVFMKAGTEYPIQMEYAEVSDYAGIRLKWQLVDIDKSEDNIPEKLAVTAAERADVAILVLGESSEVVGEGKDKSDLNLDKYQLQLLQTIYKTGTPTVVVLLNGRPICVNWMAENIPAILEAWYPGESGGDAIADILFGDYNPSGKLPISFPKNVGQLPAFYNHKPSARKGYVDGNNEPLFHFGHGLSYTKFAFSNLKLSNEVITTGESVVISIDVENIGKTKGTEVVQLYINDLISSVATPVIELKSFKKIMLKPKEKKTVNLELTSEDLSLWNKEMKRVVEPGEFEIMVGSSCKDIRMTKKIRVKEDMK